MKFYLCAVRVEAFCDGFGFGRKFCAGDICDCPCVVTADYFYEALTKVENICDSLDFACSTILSVDEV